MASPGRLRIRGRVPGSTKGTALAPEKPPLPRPLSPAAREKGENSIPLRQVRSRLPCRRALEGRCASPLSRAVCGGEAGRGGYLRSSIAFVEASTVGKPTSPAVSGEVGEWCSPGGGAAGRAPPEPRTEADQGCTTGVARFP